MKKNKTPIALLVSLMAIAGHSTALDFDDEELLELYGDDETVSISTGTNKPIRLAPSVATVITEADIERSGATTLDEVLELVPGLHVATSRSNSTSAVYSIRGIHTEYNPQVLLLIDGIPLQTTLNGGRHTRLVWPLNNIKRIEVIRGPGSAVFGSDAFSGVINVISKGALDIDGVELGASTGSFNTHSVWGQWGAKLQNNWHLSTSVEYSTSDGDDGRIIDTDVQSFADTVLGTSVSNAPGPLNTDYEILNARVAGENDQWKVAFSTWQQLNAGTGEGIFGALDPTGSFDSEYHTFDARYSGFKTKNWRFDLNLSYTHFDSVLNLVVLPAGTQVPVSNGTVTVTPPFDGIVQFPDGVLARPGGQETISSIELVSYNSRFEDHDLRFSAGYTQQDSKPREEKNFGFGIIDTITGINSQTPGIVTAADLTDVSNTDAAFLPERTREIVFVSLQDEWRIARDWTLTGGLRFDDYSDFGSTLNPRLALVWATSYNVTSKVLYGRAFRAPSMLEQLSRNNPVRVGNPNIQPETIDTVELAFDYSPSSDTNLKLSIYHYEADDLIEFADPMEVLSAAQRNALGNPTTPIAANAASQRGKGVEIEYSNDITDRLSIVASLAIQNSRTGLDGDVPDAPGKQGNLRLTWDASNTVQFNADVNWIADRQRGNIDQREPLSDFAVVNMNVRRTDLFNCCEANLAVRNVFDKQYRDASRLEIPGDYPMPSRSLMIDFVYRLK